MVEGIDEVTAELQLEPLRELEVLMQAEVQVGETRPSQPGELRSTITKARRRIGEVAVISEPLEASRGSADRCFSGDARKGIAIRTRTATECSGSISGSVYRKRPATADGDDWTNRPTSNHGIHDLVGILRQGLTVAKGKLINRISCEDVSGVVIARRPFGLWIVNVLPVCRCTECIDPGSIITGAIGHALGVGVGHLVLQAVGHLLLQDGLQRVVP